MADLNDIIRVAARQRYLGTDDIVNVLHFVLTAEGTSTLDEDVIDDLAEGISTAYAEFDAHISTAVQPVDLTFYNVSEDAPMGVRSWPAPYEGGTASGDTLPSHDSLLMLFPTNVKRRIGRIYLPPMSEASQSGGLPSGACVDAANAFAAQLRTMWEGTEHGNFFNYVVFSYSGGTASLPTSHRHSPFLAVQRRRKRGRGS